MKPIKIALLSLAVVSLSSANAIAQITQTPISVTGFDQNMIVGIGQTYGNSGITATMDRRNQRRRGRKYVVSGRSEHRRSIDRTDVGHADYQPKRPDVAAFDPARRRKQRGLDRSRGRDRRVTLTTAASYSTLELFGSTGGGTNTVDYTLNFAGGSTQSGSVSFQDWFNGGPTVAVDASGRINSGGYDAVGSTNPSIYEVPLAFTYTPGLILDSITLTQDVNSGGHTAIFGVSGMSAAPTVTWTGTAGTGAYTGLPNGTTGIWDSTNSSSPNAPTANWTGAATTYTDGDSVTFDDTGINSNIAIQSGGVAPQSVTFNNTNTPGTGVAYSFIDADGVNGITGGATVTLNGGGSVTFSGANSYTGATTISAGTLEIADPNALQNSTATVNVNGGLLFGPMVGTFNLGGLAGTGNINLVDANSQPVTISVGSNNQSTLYSGVLSGLGGGLTKVGSGTLRLGSANTYSGPTMINAGAIQLDVAGALQNSPVTVNSANGLAFGSGVGTFNLVSLAGSGSINLVDTNNQPVTLSVGSNNQSTIFSGTLTDGGLGGALTMVGTGTLTLGSANTYSGPTTINAGIVQIDDTNSLQNSTATVNVNGGLTFGPNVGTFNVGGLAGSGNINLVDTNTQQVTLSVGANNASTVYSGVLSDSGLGGGLTKVGTGTLSLASANTYSGATTVNAGAIQLNVAAPCKTAPSR